MSEIKEVIEKITDVRLVLGRMEERQEALAKQQGEHHVTLYGNGREGLVDDVRTLKESRKAVYWALTATIAVLTGVVGA